MMAAQLPSGPKRSREHLRHRQRRRPSPTLERAARQGMDGAPRPRLTSLARSAYPPTRNPSAGARRVERTGQPGLHRRARVSRPGPAMRRSCASASPTTRRASSATSSSSPCPSRASASTPIRRFGTIEAVKAVSELYSPLAGDDHGDQRRARNRSRRGQPRPVWRWMDGQPRASTTPRPRARSSRLPPTAPTSGSDSSSSGCLSAERIDECRQRGQAPGRAPGAFSFVHA